MATKEEEFDLLEYFGSGGKGHNAYKRGENFVKGWIESKSQSENIQSQDLAPTPNQTKETQNVNSFDEYINKLKKGDVTTVVISAIAFIVGIFIIKEL